MLNTAPVSAIGAVDVTNARTVSSKRAERVALIALVALYVACACGFAAVTPYGEAPDEYNHLLYVEHLVKFGTLPDIVPYTYTYESFQPPLYYMAGALVVATGRILTGKSLDLPLAPAVRVKPDRAPGVDLAVMIHPPEERWPFTVYALRGLSILLGLGVVLLTYATARTLVPPPAPAVIPLLSAAFAALIPQANFIRASVSNENLGDLMGALLVWLMALHLMKTYSIRRVFWIGVALGLAFLSKASAALLMLPLLWVLWVRHEGQRRRLLRDLALIAGLTFLIAGWLYIFRWVVYGDPLAYGAMHVMMPPDNIYPSLGSFFWLQDPFRQMLWDSFWGVFGWQQVFLPGWIYEAFIAIAVLAVGGGVYLLARRALSGAQRAGMAVLLFTLALLYALIVQASTYLVSWQGREMYPALSSVCLLLGVGLGGAVLGRGAVQPTPVARWRAVLAQGVVGAVALGLFALNVYSIVWVVLPALNT